jgi:hypothetical protein
MSQLMAVQSINTSTARHSGEGRNPVTPGCRIKSGMTRPCLFIRQVNTVGASYCRAWKREVNTQFCEPVSKRLSSVKIKAGDHFNRRHTYRMSRIEMRSLTPILAELGRFGVGSR